MTIFPNLLRTTWEKMVLVFGSDSSRSERPGEAGVLVWKHFLASIFLQLKAREASAPAKPGWYKHMTIFPNLLRTTWENGPPPSASPDSSRRPLT